MVEPRPRASPVLDPTPARVGAATEVDEQPLPLRTIDVKAVLAAYRSARRTAAAAERHLPGVPFH